MNTQLSTYRKIKIYWLPAQEQSCRSVEPKTIMPQYVEKKQRSVCCFSKNACVLCKLQTFLLNKWYDAQRRNLLEATIGSRRLQDMWKRLVFLGSYRKLTKIFRVKRETRKQVAMIGRIQAPKTYADVTTNIQLY